MSVVFLNWHCFLTFKEKLFKARPWRKSEMEFGKHTGQCKVKFRVKFIHVGYQKLCLHMHMNRTLILNLRCEEAVWPQMTDIFLVRFLQCDTTTVRRAQETHQALWNIFEMAKTWKSSSEITVSFIPSQPTPFLVIIYMVWRNRRGRLSNWWLS